MNWIDLDGTVLRYDLVGAGKTIVLIHEMGGSLNSWDLVVPLLARTHRVLRFDLRGAGFSEKQTGRLMIEDLSGDIGRLVDHVGRDGGIMLVGAAVGAAIALRHACDNPHAVAGVIGFSPVTECPVERRDGLLAHSDRIEAEGLRALAPVSIANILPEALRQDDAAFQAARCRWLANDPRSFAAIYRMLAHLDLRGDFARIAQPCLMIGATHDGLRTPADVEKVAGALPNATYLKLETSHVAAVQTPDLAARAILDFCSANGF